MLRRLLFRLLALALALLAAAAALELVSRLVPAGAAQRDTAVVERTAPSADGEPLLHGGAAAAAQGGERFRIVVVGDSFTWGHGVWPEDAYPQRLERRLQALAPSTTIEVVSWSRRGWNTAQQWRSVSDELEALAPDVLLLGYCLNDAEPANPRRRRQMWRELGWWPGDEQPPGWLARHSRLAARIRASLHNLKTRRVARSYYERIYEEGETWELNRQALLEFGRLNGRGGLRFLLVVFPIFDSQLDHRYRYRELHEIVTGVAAFQGTPYLDLLDAYRGIDARRLAVTPFTDPHPNELAHRIAADRIVEDLVARSWVPREAARNYRRRSALRHPRAAEPDS